MVGITSKVSLKPHTLKLSAEAQFIVNCVCRSIHSINAATLSALSAAEIESIDWHYTTKLAEQHGVIPLVYQSIHEIYPDLVPSEILGELRLKLHSNALKNTLIVKELLEVLKLFQNNKISVVAFKGPVLALSVYKNLALRQFCDLDILVSEHNFERAIDALVLQGQYQILSRGWHFLSQDHEKQYILSRPEYSLNNGNVTLDLHQKLITPDYFLCEDISYSYLSKRFQTLQIADQTIQTLGAEDLLIYLCIHGSKECWASLKWICDIAELLKCYPNLDWDYLLKTSQRLGSERMLALGLYMAHILLGSALPQPIELELQKNPQVLTLADTVLAQLFLLVNSFKTTNLTREKFFFYLALMRRKRDKINLFRFWFRFFRYGFYPNDKDLSWIKLSEKFYFLYYFLKPARLILKRIRF
ncbi:MAG TPA: nucleotidyltransferase family protein [Stenomitos sp.]